MRTVEFIEVKRRLTDLLAEVERGGEVLITRQGKPIARLVPARQSVDLAKGRLAADGLRSLSKGRSLGESTIRTIVDDGRK
jgi:prevent-host-death family protein